MLNNVQAGSKRDLHFVTQWCLDCVRLSVHMFFVLFFEKKSFMFLDNIWFIYLLVPPNHKMKPKIQSKFDLFPLLYL